MKLFDLGTLPWKQTQLVYHALANCHEEGVVLCTPKERYACVGFHQDPDQELNVEYCKKNNIGLFRREIGGGTVYLDKNQIFYQLIIDRDKAPLNQIVFFEKFLVPIIQTYEELGIKAKFFPICDLIVDGKKISGNGGGEIGKCKVATGSIMFDFDHELMSRILKLPSERFRLKVNRSMKKHLTNVKNELGYIPTRESIKSILISKWKDMFEKLEISKLGPAVLDEMNNLDKRFSSDDWLFKKGRREEFRDIKIIEGIHLIYYEQNGVEMCIETKDEKIRNIEIYSDQTRAWKTELKNELKNKKYEATLILNTLNTIPEK